MKIINLMILFLVLFTLTISAQWDDCPRDETNCTGECGAFIDTDNSGYCDHSEPAPADRITSTPVITETSALSELITGQELKTKTVQEVATLYKIDSVLFAQKVSEYLNVNVKTTDSFQYLHDNYGAEPSKIKEIAVALAENKEPAFQDIKEPAKKKPYVFWPLVIPFVAIYIASFFMAKRKIFSMTLHKKIWNIILFTSFFISAVLGVLLVIRLNYGWTIPLPFNMLYWHVEAGIAMFFVAVFHILWHMDYFKGVFRKK
jgi:hypothetical protein